MLSTDYTIETSDTEMSTDTVSALNPGEADPDSDSETSPLTPGTYWVGGCVDPVAGETSTSNNCSSGIVVTVVDTTAPDLVVDTVGVDKATLEPGESFLLSATTRNAGDAPSETSTLRFMLSTDSTIETSDTEMSTDTVSALNPGESDPDSDTETAPATPGTYWVGGCADPVSGEGVTTNNCSSGVAITVVDSGTVGPLTFAGVAIDDDDSGNSDGDGDWVAECG